MVLREGLENLHELQDVAWLPMTTIGFGEEVTLEKSCPP